MDAERDLEVATPTAAPRKRIEYGFELAKQILDQIIDGKTLAEDGGHAEPEHHPEVAPAT
jgi:hypothetical protein